LISCILPFPFASWGLQFAHYGIECLAMFLHFLSEQGFAVWTAAIPPMGVFLIAMLGVLYLLAPKGLPFRFLGIVYVLPLFLYRPEPVASGEFRVHALDVGQGMGLLIETAQHRLLYDTGPMYSPEQDAASRVILPFLKSQGIYHLDGLIVSHNDNDHSGGVLRILHEMPVDWLSSSLQLESPIVKAAKRHQRCLAGQVWNWDGVRFEYLHPVPSIYESPKWKTNARSCTLKISNEKFSILLPGDIEAIQEDELLHSVPEKLRADVLISPHHGSGTSSTFAFLEAVHPTSSHISSRLSKSLSTSKASGF